MTGDLIVARARTRAGERNTRTAATRRGPAAIAAVLCVLAVVMGIASPASAAPTVTYPGAISGLSIEASSGGGPLSQWQTARISGAWAVPTGAQAGQTFGMTLPAEFSRQSAGAFTIDDPSSGVALAECVVAAGQGPDMVCTLTSAVDGLEEVGGSFWMEARATQSTTNDTVTFDLGDSVEIVDLPGEGGIVPENPAEQPQPYKSGRETEIDGRLKWSIVIPSGHVSDGGFTITDTLDAGAAGHHYTGEAKLYRRAVQDGAAVGESVPVDPSDYSVVFAEDSQSFEFAATGLPDTGYSYELVYYTAADQPVRAGDVFGNHAAVNTTEVSATHTVAESGGGDGTGVQYVQFSLTKALSGTQAASARDVTYSVEYSVKGSDAPPTVLSVPVGEPVLSARAPRGSTFVIEEIDLPVIEGIVWGEWTIEGDGVSAVGDGTYEVTPGSTTPVAITLTNTANPAPIPTPTPSAPPSPSPSATSTPHAAPPARTPGGLAVTGGEGAAHLVPIAALLLLGGAIAGAVARRRATSNHR